MSNPTAEEQGFLEAILEDPFDDSLRLIYADWCHDNNQMDRGAYIKGQIRQLDLSIPGDERARLLQSEVTLATRHVRDWLGPLNELPVETEFSRGFVAAIRLTSEAFLEHA